MKKSGALIALGIVIILAAGGFALTRDGGEDTKTNQNTTTTPTTTEPPAPTPPVTSPTTNDNANASTIIFYSNDGFSPASSTVKTGSTVTVKNASSRKLEFASDPHPVHTENQELNIEAIPSGESKTFTVTKVGTWGFHNHLRPADTGTLTVE